jgi:uncharacterized protein YacL
MPKSLARGLAAGFAVLTLLLLVRGAALLSLIAAGVAAVLVVAVEIWLRLSPREERAPAAREALLDTSALIDGRIEAVVASGFLTHRLLVPSFVLRELQHVADSPDAGRRARGRRGLDVLAALKEGTAGGFTVLEDDVSEESEVDRKLLAVARARGADLVTTDFNLAKVAAVEGVAVLNLNELARALRPVVLPGETLQVTIVKEGKEAGQGVGYLDDGTMVVVEQARSAVGRTLPVVVTSGLQTAAGKMFFARPLGDQIV